MSFQNNESSDLDFSIIDKKPPEQAKLNFSVESLLSQQCRASPGPSRSVSRHRNAQSPINNQDYGEDTHLVDAEKGSFLQDLQKLQDELSFETVVYNVYQQQTNASQQHELYLQNKSCVHGKSNSNLKTTKEESKNQHTLTLDDYGYLVLDFALPKNKKLTKNHITETLHLRKLHTQQSTSNSQKLRHSQSSATITQNPSLTTTNSNAKNKSPSLNKLLSPRLSKNIPKSSSKEKDLVKPIKSKSKDPKTQLKNTLEKTCKILSKPKSIHKHLNNSKKTNISTTIAQTSNKTSKSYTKSTRQANAFSEYYGFQDLGDSERLVMKSNCLKPSESEKNVGCFKKRSPNCFLKKSSSKSKCKKSMHSPSPSHQDLTLRFKKKKTKQIN